MVVDIGEPFLRTSEIGFRTHSNSIYHMSSFHIASGMEEPDPARASTNRADGIKLAGTSGLKGPITPSSFIEEVDQPGSWICFAEVLPGTPDINGTPI